MILEYHRPQTIEEALALLARQQPVTVPLAGGSAIQRLPQPVAVVDLQALGLNTFQQQGNSLELGAALTLQSLLEALVEQEFKPLQTLPRVIMQEATHNLRQVASLAGTLVVGDSRSPLTTALLALDASLTLLPGDEIVRLGDFLPFRSALLPGRLIRSVTLPVNVKLAYEAVARTPADWPLVSAAVARWPSGRLRVVLGGYGALPSLVFDGAAPGGGSEADGAVAAAQSAYSQAGDEWASAEYRQEVAGILVQRCLMLEGF